MKIHKNMTNLEIADLLNAVSASYKLKPTPGSQFKVIAYERAADAVEHLSSEAKDLWDDDKLEEVAGIGKSIAGHLDEIFSTGSSKHFKVIMKGIPPATFELLKVSGIGPKTAVKIAEKFDDQFKKGRPLKALKKLAQDGQIAEMDGFTLLTQESILKSVDEVKGQKDKRLLLPYAEGIAQEVVEWLLKDKNITRADPLGSLRRRASTVGDIDITVSAKDPLKALERFTKYPKATRVVEKGERSASIIIGGGRRVDVIACKPKAYGALLQHFTGSKHHNVALREYALKHKLSLSDYGIYEIGKDGKRNLKEIATEIEFYAKLKMDWIPPELREGKGEIEAALGHQIPKLVEIKDLKSDLHMHSDFDIETSHDVGANGVQEYIDKANSLGYEYIAFTEHNPSRSTHKDKEIIALIKRKKDLIDKINYSLVKGSEKTDGKGKTRVRKARPHASGVPARIDTRSVSGRQATVGRVFNSLEIDMLPTGGLPVPDAGLEFLDFALVSIHSSFRLSRDKMTQRVLKSLEHPKAKIFAHPTGRKLNEREGVELEWEKIFEFCLANGKWIEINSSPSRLDLPDVLVKEAIDAGVKLTLGTDAHHIDQMDLMPYGISVARRGWCTKEDIVNTRSLKQFEKMLE